MSVRLDYDYDVGALYITLASGDVARTVEVDDETMVDLDVGGHLLGIEVIDYQRAWPLTRILADYPVAEVDAAQLRALFGGGGGRVQQGSPTPVPA